MSSIAILGTGYRSGARTSAKRTGLNRLFLIIVLLLIAVFALEITFHFVVAPKLLIKNINVEVSKDFPVSNQALVDLAGLDKPAYFFSVSPAHVAANLETNPLIKSVTVTKSFPNTLTIAVRARTPLAMALVNDNGRSVPVAFDEDGVAVEIGDSSGSFNMPIISGVDIPQAKLGMRLPPELAGFLTSLAALKSSSPLLYSLISEVQFIRTGGTSYDVMLYPSAYHVPVLIGETIDAHLMKYIMMVLDVVQKEGISAKVSELDFRTGQVIYQMREGS